MKGKPVTILLVEDDKDDCDKFINLAERRNDIKIIGVVNSSDEGIKYVESQSPDGVILDLELLRGRGSGLEFLTGLKNLDLRQKPIIIVNTNTPSGLVHDYIRKVGADFIFYKKQKGYTPDSVVNTLLVLWKTLYEESDDYDDENNESFDGTFPSLFKGKKEYIVSLIQKEMDAIGVGVRYVGRKYLESAIALIIDRGDDSSLSALNEVAGSYEVSYSSVIRSMQTAINNAWYGSGYEELAKNYTARVDKRTGVPSPTEFIYYYADKIRKAL